MFVLWWPYVCDRQSMMWVQYLLFTWSTNKSLILAVTFDRTYDSIPPTQTWQKWQFLLGWQFIENFLFFFYLYHQLYYKGGGGPRHLGVQNLFIGVADHQITSFCSQKGSGCHMDAHFVCKKLKDFTSPMFFSNKWIILAVSINFSQQILDNKQKNRENRTGEVSKKGGREKGRL